MSASGADRSGRGGPQLAAAFAELRQLVGHLSEELSGFRRRALQAEGQLRDLMTTAERAAIPADGDAPPTDPALAARVAELERENAELRRRVETASQRTRRLLDRVRFLRQQHEGTSR